MLATIPIQQVRLTNSHAFREFPTIAWTSRMFPSRTRFYVGTPSSTSQTPCSAGSFNPDFQADDMSDCTLADTGHYVALEGQSLKTHAFPVAIHLCKDKLPATLPLLGIMCPIPQPMSNCVLCGDLAEFPRFDRV